MRERIRDLEFICNVEKKPQRLTIDQANVAQLQISIPPREFILFLKQGGANYYYVRKPNSLVGEGRKTVVKELSLLGGDQLSLEDPLEPMVVKLGLIESKRISEVKCEVEIFNKVYGDTAKLMHFPISNRLQQYAIIMKKIPGVALDKYFQKNRNLNDRQKLDILLAVLKALKELHQAHGIIHFDLTCKNIHLECKGDEYQASILDFGLSCDREKTEVAPSHDLFVLLNELYFVFGYSYIFLSEQFLLSLKQNKQYTVDDLIQRVSQAKDLLNCGVEIGVIGKVRRVISLKKYAFLLVAVGSLVSAGCFVAGGLALSNPLGWVGLGVGILAAFVITEVERYWEKKEVQRFTLFSQGAGSKASFAEKLTPNASELLLDSGR